MKKSTVAIIILLLLVIFGVIFYLYYIDVSKKHLQETLENAEKQMQLNSRISELEEQLENQSNKQNVEELKFDSSKIKSDFKMVTYEEDNVDRGSAGLEIEIKNGKPYLSVNKEDEQYKFLFSEVTQTIKDKEITGFNSNVVDVYFAFMGNGDMAPIILFLMEDGKVEFANSNKMLKFEKYQSFGKIEELSNIIKFVNLQAHDLDENGEQLGGFATVAAIDKDGYSFDLSASKTIQNDMLSSAY